MKSGISWSSGLCLPSGKWKRPLPTFKTLFACKCTSIYLSLWETVCLAQWNLPGSKRPRQRVHAFVKVCSQFTILKVSRRWPLTLLYRHLACLWSRLFCNAHVFVKLCTELTIFESILKFAFDTSVRACGLSVGMLIL